MWEDDSYGYGYEDEINYADNNGGEEDVPPELDEATLAVEDAYINYLDSRKKMRELALSRGFSDPSCGRRGPERPQLWWPRIW